MNSGCEIPDENEVLDARVKKQSPEVLADFRRLEIHERNLRYEKAQLEAALDEQIENLEEANSGSESVHDYFSYSTSYPIVTKYFNTQTLPSSPGSISDVQASEISSRYAFLFYENTGGL